MSNDPPTWYRPTKGSEHDRLLPLRLPNKFVNPGVELEPGSPRRFPKDESLDDRVREHDFALGLLAILVQRRIQRGGVLHKEVTMGARLNEVLARRMVVRGATSAK